MAKRSVKKANFTIGTVMKLGRKRTVTQPDGSVITKIKRTRKRPNSPKKAKCAYIFFLQETFKQLKEKDPSLTMTAVASQVGVVWQKLPPCERARWEEMARADKERYFVELEAWKLSQIN